MKRSLQWALVAAGTASVLAAGFVGGRAWAGGIPSKGALTYSGVLQKPDGSALTSTGHNLEIKLWSTGPTGGTVLCTTAVPAPTPEAICAAWFTAFMSAATARRGVQQSSATARRFIDSTSGCVRTA